MKLAMTPTARVRCPTACFTLEVYIAMIVNHTGIELTQELLRSGQFQVGDSLE
ncbi:unannotated protein [freshwater metagenome]|uniref:Unannotated protein n=1 Tax=freshwater metagenome TaxID=449393 RepID=A0A6J7H2B8_9ZZZZ